MISGQGELVIEPRRISNQAQSFPLDSSRAPATCYPSFMDQLSSKIAVESRVLQDGKVVTSRGPGTAFKYVVVLVELLYGKEKSDEVAKPLDVMLLDHSVFFGMVDVHDRHRDMRLDVDNMSYEELLALEERMGNVYTGLTEENITTLLKTHKHVNIRAENSVETEPCSICQVRIFSFTRRFRFKNSLCFVTHVLAMMDARGI